MFLSQVLRKMAGSSYKFIDIGANLTDPVYQGIYHGKEKHEIDFEDVLKRGKDVGLKKAIITGGSLSDCKEAVALAKTKDMLYTTVGCHPTRCTEFENDPQRYLDDLSLLCTENKDKVVAVGECGMDGDRTHFCPIDVQAKYFEMQFDLAKNTNLPMFLHFRNANPQFTNLLKQNRNKFSTGVVHSFTGTFDEAKTFMDLNLFIGINGCSLKTKENLETMCKIPSDKLMIETDCPWCDIRPTHAGSKHIQTKFQTKKKWEKDCCVKSRNELCHIVQVLEVMACERKEDPKILADIMYENTMKVFFP